MSNFEYISTKNGLIHRNDVPLVVDENFNEKLDKTLLFFVVSVVVLLIIIYMSTCEQNTQKVSVINKKVVCEGYKVIPKIVSADSISVYDKTGNTNYLENIIFVDKNNNTFDIDVLNNKFLTKNRFYSIDLQNIHDIKQIILVSKENNKYITLNLYNLGKVVWEYSGIINKNDNTIIVSDRVLKK